METARLILEGDTRRAAGHLARFWGREQDYALGFLFGTNGLVALLADPSALVLASREIVDQLHDRSNSFHAIVAQANLVHHLSRVSSAHVTSLQDEGGRQTALAFRSQVMGRLISTNDPSLAEIYSRRVKSSPLAALVEDWAFPTYTHDARPTVDFSLPRSLLLRETAAEIVREIESYSEAYLVYLTQTAIPSVLGRDETFGLARDRLAAALRCRRETVTLPEAANACDAMLQELGAQQGPSRGGLDFDDEW